MNLLLWTLQILLGVFFTFHGAAALVWAAPLRETFQKLPYPKGFLQFIGLCELLGGLGLILPWWLGIAPVLTPLAALGLSIIMLGAMVTHVRAGETPQIAITAVMVTLLLIVAFARL